MDDQIRDLACARAAVRELEDEVVGIERALANSPLGVQRTQLRKRLADMKKGRDDLDDTIRLEALATYTATGHTRPHQAVQIKKYKTLTYDPAEAKEFCIRSYPKCLKLDKRAFEKAAKVLEPDFVVFGDEPRVAISRDLSAYLNREEEGETADTISP